MGEARGLIGLDEVLAERLVRSQFPELAGEDVRPLPAAGTDNHIFRIGDDLCARFPKVAWAAVTAAREARALPRFEGAPLPVPHVYGLGAPTEDYPHQWSVLTWLPGHPLADSTLTDPLALVRSLAAFFRFVREVPPDAGFDCGAANNGRGAPLVHRNDRFQAALQELPGIDQAVASRLWAEALRAYDAGAPVWLHGDVHPGNILVEGERLSGIIDWGLCGVGDGACDLLTAWALFDSPARENFRKAMEASDADWLRGAGWALSMAVIFLPYARDNNLPHDMSERMIERLMEEFA